MQNKKWDYTSLARRFSARFPLLSYLGIQINFWILANIFLVSLMHLQALSIQETFKGNELIRFDKVLLLAVVLGLLYGIVLGLTDRYLERFYKQLSLGKIILFKTGVSVSVIIMIVVLLRAFFFGLTISEQSWEYFFYILVIYYLLMTLMLSFINQVNRKYGPGVLVPLLLGKYRSPREEERIFMFMDLQSSTTIAEQLGHLKYSSFIRDSFMDINEVLLPHNAEVYQYVGDEIVVTWRIDEGLKFLSCIRFFFACEYRFFEREQYYMSNYGVLPRFKASLHMGKVTAVEIGEVKRDIAYHGDTLNTAARIQSVCNDYNKRLLISTYMLEAIGANSGIRTETIGMIQLKGKATKVGIASVEGLDA
ncbi:adenylate/guanylate cyclase domain-containing protein [Chitinophaga sp. SYP-B3965]|uniref:adenylate/guanylate cyclase domain-containing protein n=1 Tax=Chitinophaga sp. SYP-B3965 TaxID=2663120 RepID=UPI0012999754|nr:adenylate/guanylate cyclase domain-containing protein [Chitinophaga sp. SYP-B3965]MRG44631.1 adenylate/guanylate cyclase domain-containing protein [Chitinophaga sp. SYP-B3965]